MLRSIPISMAALVASLLAHSLPTVADPSDQKPTRFLVRIENVSTDATLRLSDGTTAPAPTAPVLWVVHTGSNPLFVAGESDGGQGLESLAEDGSPDALVKSLKGASGIVAVGAMAIPVGATEPGPLLPGSAYEFSFTAEPGQRLTLAMMFGQSNDLFYAPDGRGIELFGGDGQPRRGDITSLLVLWDAGTEINQEPGAGPDQAPRQAAPDTGASENGTVRAIVEVDDGFTYPTVGEVIRITLTPVPTRASE
jgi:hypothetical protein